MEDGGTVFGWSLPLFFSSKATHYKTRFHNRGHEPSNMSVRRKSHAPKSTVPKLSSDLTGTIVKATAVVVNGDFGDVHEFVVDTQDWSLIFEFYSDQTGRYSTYIRMANGQCHNEYSSFREFNIQINGDAYHSYKWFGSDISSQTLNAAIKVGQQVTITPSPQNKHQ